MKQSQTLSKYHHQINDEDQASNSEVYLSQVSTRADFEDSYSDYLHLSDAIQAKDQFQNYQQGLMTFTNLQGECENFREGNRESFQILSKHLQESDFSAFHSFWNENFVSKLNFIADNWQEYSLTYEDGFKQFLGHYKNNIELFKSDSDKLYNYFYPGLTEFIQKIERKTEYKYQSSEKKDKNPSNQMMVNNGLFQQYIREQSAKAQEAGCCFINLKGKQSGPNQRQPIGEYIAQNNVFDKNREEWKMILFEATAARRFNKKSTNNKERRKFMEQVYQFSELVLKNYELTQPNNRLCCAKFFNYGFDLQPFESSNLITRKHLFKLKEKGNQKKSVKKIDVQAQDPQEMENIMLQLCALLNKGGGVLLFNCEEDYLETKAIGCTIYTDDKKKYLHLIKEGIKRIFPEVKMDCQIRVSFVPIVKDPYQFGYDKQVLDDQDRKIRRKYIEGLYILRISVFPQQKQKLYCYQTTKSKAESAIMKANTVERLKGMELVKEMKQRYEFFELEQETDQLKQLLGKDFQTEEENHVCVQPYLGLQLSLLPKPLPPDQKTSFSYVSLLVVGPKHFATVEKRLKDKGIDCHINRYFLDKFKDFKLAQSSAPIHHNVRFGQLLTETAYKKQFTFDGKPLVLVNITQCIRLTNKQENQSPRLSQAEFNQLQKWFQHQQITKGAKLEYWFRNESTQEHYLRVNKQLPMIYLFYVLHKLNKPSQFKNPASTNKQLSGNRQIDGQRYRQNLNQTMKRLYSKQNNKLYFDD